MKLVFSLIACLYFVPAEAEVIVYKHRFTQTERLDEAVDKSKFSGWTVIDIQTGQAAFVLTSGNNFRIEQPASDLASITRAENAKALGIIAVKEGTLSGLMAKGFNKSVDIGLDQNWNIPRTLVVSGSRLVLENTGFFPGPLVSTNHFSLNSTAQESFGQFKGSMVYDRVNTLQVNSQSLDFDATLLHLKNLLLAKGFRDQDQEVQNPNGPAVPTAGKALQLF